MSYKSFKLALAGIVLLAVAGCDKVNETPAANAGGDTKPAATGGDTTTAANRPASTGEGNTATGDTIPIGIVASMSGPQQPWGVDCVNGAKLAVDEFNKAGGINGKKVILFPMDDASKADQGKSAVEKLIGDNKVLAIIGEVASGITLQMAPTCQAKGVPDVAVGATRDEITDIGNEIFRVCYTDALQGPVMAQFAYKDLGLRKVAMMTDKTQPYSTGLSKSFAAAFTKLGGTIVKEEFYETGQTQFTAQLTNLQKLNPEGVFASGYFPEVGPMVKQAADDGMKIPFFGGDGWDTNNIAQTGGKAIIGDYYCNHYTNDEKSPEVQNFLTKWTAAYNSKPATAMGALGYDATAVVLNGLKNAKGLNSKDLRDAIDNTVDFKGVTGSITLKGHHGDPPKRALVVQVQPQGTIFKAAIDPSQLTN
ncbi:MAG TPA: ABC transporter substrate-binding protein [Fimbriimonas sp.]|nr:ABC transporter substrate-binding protein [Fimbriimonas sp.]